MTVGELRQITEGLLDDTEVEFNFPEGYETIFNYINVHFSVDEGIIDKYLEFVFEDVG